LIVIKECHVIEKVKKAISCKCVNWDESLWRNGGSQPFKVDGARVAGRVDDFKRDLPPLAFRF
jgi:hypothetical protein